MSNMYEPNPSWVRFTSMAYELRDADKKDIRAFARALFDSLDDDERRWWFNLFARELYPKERWRKMRIWMERRYEKNYEWTPRRMASTYLNCSRMDSKMMPLLIKTARQVKNMIRMRRKREEEKAWDEEYIKDEGSFDD